jgi:hypothetical protein
MHAAMSEEGEVRSAKFCMFMSLKIPRSAANNNWRCRIMFQRACSQWILILRSSYKNHAVHEGPDSAVCLTIA